METITPAPARRLTLAEVLEIKRRGGQITYNLVGDLVITYPRWAVDAFALEVLAERPIS